MPIFAIVATDRPDAGTLRADTRPRHLDYLERIRDRIVLAGARIIDDRPAGSIIVAEFADLAGAQAFAAADPYAEAGLFAHVSVTAFRQVLP